MPRIDKINKKLSLAFGDRVCATEEQGCLVLRGALDNWQDLVEAGRLCADRKHYRGLVNKIEFTGGEVPPMHVPTLRDSALEGGRPDVLVVGAGVVGCAIARELTRSKLNVLLAEKEHDVGLQASSHNDGMVHPGIDLRKGQVKQLYNSLGNKMYDEICAELQVPFTRVGQYLCLQSAWLRPFIGFAVLHWRHLGIRGMKVLGRKELTRAEPGFDKGIAFAVLFPSAGVVCPYELTIAYAENAVQNGAKLSLNTAVMGMEVKNGRIESVKTNRGTLYPRVVVNAAGVFSDELAEMAGDRFFSIHPRKGTNSILDKKAASQVHGVASSLATWGSTHTHTKGGGLVHTVDDNLLVGPDATETFEREDYATSAASIAGTFAKQRLTSPALSIADIITYFTGVRAATYEEDFVIEKGRETRNLVHAAGIQSPGLTAAPAIGVAVARLAVEILEQNGAVEKNTNFCPERPAIARAAKLPPEERDALIRQDPDYGVIVCRCEEISKGEILAAMRRPVPCDTVDGIKRRVRPGMGRCQGGFCGPLVATLIAQERGLALCEVKKSGEGSNLVLCPTKEVCGDEQRI